MCENQSLKTSQTDKLRKHKQQLLLLLLLLLLTAFPFFRGCHSESLFHFTICMSSFTASIYLLFGRQKQASSSVRRVIPRLINIRRGIYNSVRKSMTVQSASNDANEGFSLADFITTIPFVNVICRYIVPPEHGKRLERLAKGRIAFTFDWQSL